MSQAQQIEAVQEEPITESAYSVQFGSPYCNGEYGYHAMKRAIDIVLAVAAIALLAPVFLLLWHVVRRDGGKAFYGHVRVGRDGKLFECLKFRSMVPDAGTALERILMEDPAASREWFATRKLTNDPRVTRIGRFLRATSLDEIPQIINVLRGDMSLVGPRPVVREELERHYAGCDAAYLSVRPGITGLWQVSGRSDTSYEERVSLDCRYVEELSLGNDLRILLRTVPAVLKRSGAR